MSIVIAFEIGCIIGFALFMVCMNAGLIHKWSGVIQKVFPELKRLPHLTSR